MKLVFDIEANGLLRTVTKCWMIVCIDLTTKQEFIFCDFIESLEPLGSNEKPIVRPLKEFKKLFDKATELYGHNILSYDLPALKKLFGWKPNKNTRLVDTLLMSQVLNYKRFPRLGNRHSLAAWGQALNYPKVEHEDWSQFSNEMLHRCRVDVSLNLKVKDILFEEFKKLPDTSKARISKSLRNEHSVAEFCARAAERGWLFDKAKAEDLLVDMSIRLKEIEDFVNPQLFLQLKKVDSVNDFKKPKYLKSGIYDQHTAKYFGIDQKSALDETNRLVDGPYCRIAFEQPDVGSLEAVKELLYSKGWEPDDWNYKDEATPNGGYKKVKTTPKLSSSSLEPLGELGATIDKYYTIRSRHSVLTSWLKVLTPDSRLHGDCFTIGTPTGRARHAIITNVPSAGAVYGDEIRSLFICDKGNKIIGADSSGNQFRALCHYLKNPQYTEAVVSGNSEDGTDVHTLNAKALSEILKEEVSRKKGKTFIYALTHINGAYQTL
jgi:DNA polymerase I